MDWRLFQKFLRKNLADKMNHGFLSDLPCNPEDITVRKLKALHLRCIETTISMEREPSENDKEVGILAVYAWGT